MHGSIGRGVASRRRFLAGAAATGAALACDMLPGRAWAQSYPTRPLQLIVPFAAGGTVDGVGRVVAQLLGERLGQNIVVDNRAGAGGIMGSGVAAHAAPDGYTLLLGATESFGMTASVVKQLSYDPAKDLAPVILLSRSPDVIAVNPAVKAKTMKEFIELAKANPGKLHYGSPGVGSAPHLIGESLRQKFGIDIVHVPYKGGGNGVVDVISGQIEVLITGGATVARYTDGSLRFLAYTSDKRSILLPDVPTMAEAGIPGLVLGTCCAVFAPGGTPQPVLDRLSRELVPITQNADFRERLAKIGHDVLDPLTGPAVTKFMVAEAENWRAIAQRAGVA